MGIHFINCLVCGCCLSNTKIITKSELLDIQFPVSWWKLSEFPETMIKEAVYGYERLRGQHLKLPQNIADELLSSYEYVKEYDWLNDLIAVTRDSVKTIAIDMPGDRNTIFDEDYNELDAEFINRYNYTDKVYIMHKNCYELLKKNGYDMSYKVFETIDNIKPIGRTRISSENIKYNRFVGVDYGIIDKYKGEYNCVHPHWAYVNDKYVLEDPLKSEDNAERILDLAHCMFNECRL